MNRTQALQRLAGGGLAAIAIVLLASCGGAKVEPLDVIESQTMDQTSVNWKRSEMFDHPVLITGNGLWRLIQERLGKKLRDVDFTQYSVVGAFAVEPDMPPKKRNSQALKDRGYGVTIKSIIREKDGAVTVRLKIKSAPTVKRSRGPLHYALAIIPRTETQPVFYVNGKKYEIKAPRAFVPRPKDGGQ